MEAAKHLGVSRSTVYALRARGELRVCKIAGRTVISATELDRFAAQIEGAAA
ncbi:MAG: helix-turn-helix domain-containing protein [Pararhodobacter sp.]|nr:helix-turn-helix domain-containing protein [Pararhodobacter sp.]